MGKILFMVFVILLLVTIVFASGCTSKVCGTHTETYTTSAQGCDQMSNCRCLHQSWGGLGSCDSCECTKEVSNC